MYIDKRWPAIAASGELPAYMELEDGMWIENPWDMTGERGEWLPENRSASWRCLIRTICDPQTKEYYVTGSCRDNLLSVQPGAAGNYIRLTLEDTPEQVNESARSYAQQMLLLAERDIDMSGARDNAVRIGHLDDAKAALLEGFNYQFLANCAEDENDFLDLTAKSTTAFCRAQSFAQMAQDDPHKIAREGKDVFVPGAFIGG